MKTWIYILLLISSLLIAAEGEPKLNAEKQDSTKKVDTKENLDSALKEMEGMDLDKEFYNTYFLTIPQETRREKVRLEANLIKAFTDELCKKDYKACKPTPPDIKISSTKYEKVYSDSVWISGLQKAVRAAGGYVFVQMTDYMYIIKYKKYMALICYDADPMKHKVSPIQVELIFKKEPLPFEER